jgi:hypothetical protein
MLSYYLTIILSYYHNIILSYYHTIILSYYHTIILSYYHTILLSFTPNLLLYSCLLHHTPYTIHHTPYTIHLSDVPAIGAIDDITYAGPLGGVHTLRLSGCHVTPTVRTLCSVHSVQ